MRRYISKELEGMKAGQDVPATPSPMLTFVYQLRGVNAERLVDGLSPNVASVVVYHASRAWLAVFSFQVLSMQVYAPFPSLVVC